MGLRLRRGFQVTRSVRGDRARPLLVLVASWLALLLLAGVGADLAFAGTATFGGQVGTNNSSGSTNTLSVTVGAAGVPVNSTIYVVASENSNTAGSWSATDTKGNTYTANVTFATNRQVSIFSAPVTTALVSGNTITVTYPVAGNLRRVVSVFYAKGIRLVSAFDKSASASATSTAWASGTYPTLTQAVEFVVAAGSEPNAGAFSSPSCTAPASSLASSATSLSVAPFYKNVTATTGSSCTATVTSAAWNGIIATYKVDTTNPNAPTISFPAAASYSAAGWTGTISGGATDDTGGSGVTSTAVQIKDNTANQCWSGTAWAACPTNTSGVTSTATTWSVSFVAANLTNAHSYMVSATSTDGATNTSATTSQTFTYDTSAPTVTSLTASNANGTYGPAAVIHVQVVFSEAVNVAGTPLLLLETGVTDRNASYVSGSGSSTLTFDYTVQAGDASADLDAHDVNALTLGGGTIRDPAGNDAVRTVVVGAANSGALANAKAIVVDTAAPVVTGVTASNANGTYGPAAVIHVQVVFSEAVNVAGTPLLLLETGVTDRNASYVSGSGSSTLTFDYTVQAGDASADLDAHDVNALTLGGGTIRDPAGNDAVRTVVVGAANSGALANAKAIVVDTAAPVVTGVTASNANGTYGPAAVIHVQVVFSEAVNVAGTPLLLLETGVTDRNASYVSGSGSSTLTFDYTVQAGDASADLDAHDVNALTLGGGTIRDPAGNDAVRTVVVGAANSGALANAKNVVVDTTAPAVTRVSAVNANGAYGAGVTIQVQMTFSEPVFVTLGVPTLALNTAPARTAGFASGAGTSTLLFSYVVAAGDTAAHLAETGTSALAANGAVIADGAGNSAVLTLPAAGSGNSLGDTAQLVIDTTAPTVTSLSASNPNGAYKVGQVIHVHTVFSEPVTVSGTPRLLLETGATDQSASYVSGSGTSNLTFDYTVQAGDTSSDLDSHDASGLTLNGGTMQDAAGNAAVRTVTVGAANAGSLANSSDIVVDTTVPSVLGVTATDANGSYHAGQVIHIRVNLSEPVIVSGTPRLTLETGATDAVVDYAGGSGTSTLSFDYTVTAGDGSSDLDGHDSAALALNGGSIRDAAGNDAVRTLTVGAANSGSLANAKDIAIDTVIPTVVGITTTNANGIYRVGDLIHLRVAFSKSVLVTGTPQLALETGASDESVSYSSGSGSSTLTFDYTVQSGDATEDLDAASSGALTLNGGTIADAAGNNATLTLVTGAGNPGALANASDIVVDTTAPTVSAVTATNADGAYHAGQVIHVQVQFSETVTVAGLPQLTLETGATDETVNYMSGSGTAILVFDYTIQNGDNAGRLDAQSASALTLNGGTIRDRAANNADRTLAIGANANGALAHTKALAVDTTAPAVAAVNAATPDGAYRAGQHIQVQVTFSEPVTVTGTPRLTLESGASDETVDYTSTLGNVLTFDYLIQPGDTSGDLDVHDANALVLNGGAIVDPAGNAAVRTLPTGPGNSASLAGSRAIVIDTTSPTVSLLTATNTNGAYKAGDVVHLQAVFSEPVTVTGSPELTVETGTTDAVAHYVGGSGTSTLAFDYTVQAGENSSDLDARDPTALSANGGSILDAAGNNATLTLITGPANAGSLANSKDIVVDTSAPTVVGVTSSNADGVYNGGNLVHVQVQMSEPVVVSGAPVLILSTGGAGHPADYVGGSGTNTLTFNYVVQVGDTSADLDGHDPGALASNGGTIADPVGNSAVLTIPTGTTTSGSLANAKDIVLDTTAPLVSTATSSDATGSHNPGDTIHYQVSFSEPVFVTATPLLTLATAGGNRSLTYASGAGNSTLAFTYTFQTGDTAADLDMHATAALALSGGTIRDHGSNDLLVVLGTFSRAAANQSTLSWQPADPPVGTIVPYAGSTAAIPSGWVIADGSTLNRDDFAELFNAIGTAYGAPSSTTFKIPDFGGRLPLGMAADATGTGWALGQYGGAATLDHPQSFSLASHTHTFVVPPHSHSVNGVPPHSHTGVGTLSLSGGGPDQGVGYDSTLDSTCDPACANGWTSVTGGGGTFPSTAAAASVSVAGSAPPYQSVRFLVKVVSIAASPCDALWASANPIAPTGTTPADGGTATGVVAGCLASGFGTTKPDLRGRFAYGQSASGVGSALGESGGALNHGHQVTIGAHTYQVVVPASTHDLQEPAFYHHVTVVQPNFGYNYNPFGDWHQTVWVASATSGPSSTAGVTRTSTAAGGSTIGVTIPVQTVASTPADPPYIALSYGVYTSSTYTPEIGTVIPYAGSTAPAGWVIANGSCVETNGPYAALFEKIGYAYGGSGSSFCLPDLSQRFPLGRASSGTGSILGAKGGAIDHTHSFVVPAENPNLVIPPHSHSWVFPPHHHEISVDWGNSSDCCNSRHVLGNPPINSTDSPPITVTSADSAQQTVATSTPIAAYTATTPPINPPYVTVNYLISIGKDVVADVSVRHDPSPLAVGTILPYAGNPAALPAGWVLAGGQSISRTDYAPLFAAIGTTYGSSSGSTFNVPDLHGRIPIGKSASGTTSTLGATGGHLDHGGETIPLQSHTHIFDVPDHTHSVNGVAPHTHTWSAPQLPGNYQYTGENGEDVCIAGGDNPCNGAVISSDGGSLNGSCGNACANGWTTSGPGGAQTVTSTSASPSPTATVSAANPPFQTVSYIIEATDTAAPPCGAVYPTAAPVPPATTIVADGRAATGVLTCVGSAFAGNVPDLRGRFALAQAQSGTGSTLAGTGGQLAHTHTVTVSAHSHTVTLSDSTHTIQAPDSSHTVTYTRTDRSEYGGPDCCAVVATYLNGTSGGASTAGATLTSTPAGGGTYPINTPQQTFQTSAADPPYLAMDYTLYTTASYTPDVGVTVPFAGATVPRGWALADGSCVSTTGQYADLFTRIGYTYDQPTCGNGLFRLPDLRGRMLLGRAASGQASTFGAKGGSFDHTHTLTVPGDRPTLVIGPHTHSWTLSAHTHSISAAGGDYTTCCGIGSVNHQWLLYNYYEEPWDTWFYGSTVATSTASPAEPDSSAPSAQQNVLARTAAPDQTITTTADNPPYIVVNFLISLGLVDSELQAPTLHANGADLSWTQFPAAGFTGYQIYRSRTPNFTPSPATLVSSIGDPKITTYNDTTAAPGTAFSYIVLADGIPSTEVDVTLPADAHAVKTLQPNSDDGKAATITRLPSSTNCANYGQSGLLSASSDTAQTSRALLSFDLRDIPAGAQITGATLSLWRTNIPATSETVEVHRATAAWTEGTGSGTCTGDGTTWYDTNGGIRWATDGSDYLSTPAATASIAGAAQPAWTTWDVTSLVASWTDGTAPNLGLLVKLADETASAAHRADFVSDDDGTPGLRPKLVIYYVDGSHAAGPTASLSSPQAGSELLNTVHVAAAAADDGHVTGVDFLVDGNVIGSSTTPPYQLDWNTHAVGNGTHQFALRATDDAGNQTTSDNVPVTINNSAPPTASVASAVAGSGGAYTVTASASDDVAVTKVEFLADGIQFGEDTTAPYAVTWSTLDPAHPDYDGTHQLTVIAYDGGSQSTTSANYPVTVANTAGTRYKATYSTTAVPPTALYDPNAQTQQQIPVDVTITNTSSTTWTPSDTALRYRWIGSGTTTDGSSIALPANLAPNASTTITVSVNPVSLPEGVRRAAYTLRFDLYDTTNSLWFAGKGNKPSDAIVEIDKVLDTELGLERYYQYNGEQLGAGAQSLVNLASGNAIVRWTPFSDPGRGLSTVLDLTYNSMEGQTPSPVGNGFSFAISSLTRFGSPLDIHPNAADTAAGRTDKHINLTDGDGTTHQFNSTDGVYWSSPAGVNLYLRQYSTTDATRKWALTRPDRVTFYYDSDGYPTFVNDANGNQLTFTLATVNGVKRVTAVTDAGGRSFNLTYYGTTDTSAAAVLGRLKRVTDHLGKALDFDYYDDGNLLRITQRGGTNADGSALADRAVVFTYTDANGNPAIATQAARLNPDPATTGETTRLYSVIDPRGGETTFNYSSDGRLTSRTNRAGETTSFSYDTVNKKTTVTKPISRLWQYTYDSEGKVTKITNPLNQDLNILWTTKRKISKVTEPTGKYTEYAYNDNGYLTDVWDELRNHTLLSYTNSGVDGGDTSGHWEPGRTSGHISQLALVTDPNGTATTTPTNDYQWSFGYDSNGNLTSVQDPQGKTTLLAYNSDGTLNHKTDANQHTTTFVTYDNNGFATEIHDAKSQVTKLSYDDGGLLRWVQDPLHASYTGGTPETYRTFFYYDSFGRLGRQSAPKSTVDALGTLIWSNVQYDANDNLVTRIAPYFASDGNESGAKTTTAFDAMDRPTLVTGPDTSVDPAGERTRYTYDGGGRLTQIESPKGVLTPSIGNDFSVFYSYDDLDRVIRQTRYNVDGSGTVQQTLNTHYCYSTAGDLVRVTAPKADLATVDCSAAPPSFTTRYLYDDAHRLFQQTNPLGNTKSATYDASGNVLTSTNENGDTTTRSYDQDNRLVKVVAPYATGRNLTTQYVYDNVGNLSQLISPRAWDASTDHQTFTDYVTKYVYDELDRMTRTDLPTASSSTPTYIHRIYDANSNLLATTLPTTLSTPTNVPASEKTTLSYWDTGWIRTATDPTRNPVHFDYDAQGHQTVRVPDDNSGQLALDREMLWSYYADGMVKETHDLAGEGSTYSYDANNNLAGATEASGLATAGQTPLAVSVAYDGLDQMAKVSTQRTGDANLTATSYSYDLNGNLVDQVGNQIETSGGSVVTSGRHTTFAYDSLDRPTTEVDYGLDPAVSDDQRITTGYTPASWLASRQVESSNGSGGWSTTQNTAYTYFINGLQKTQLTTNGSGSTLESHTLSYETGGIFVNGNKTSDTFRLVGPDTSAPCRTSDCTATWSYDAIDRLTQETDGHGTTRNYTLDTPGNVVLQQTIVNGQTTSRNSTYNGQQLRTQTDAGVTKRFFYDIEGRLSCVTADAGSSADCNPSTGQAVPTTLLEDYGYDYRGRLASYHAYTSGAQTDSAGYSYDPLDRPVKEQENHPQATPKTTLYTYLGLSNDLAAEQQKNTATGAAITTRTYSYDAFDQKIGITDDPAGGSKSTYTYAYDPHGSVSLLLNSVGTPSASYGYTAYGDVDPALTTGAAGNVNSYRYTNKRFDSGSGTLDMGARRFSPTVGRYLQQDFYYDATSDLGLSTDPITANRYALAGGNPVGYVESDGHRPEVGPGEFAIFDLLGTTAVTYGTTGGGQAVTTDRNVVAAAETLTWMASAALTDTKEENVLGSTAALKLFASAISASGDQDTVQSPKSGGSAAGILAIVGKGFLDALGGAMDVAVGASKKIPSGAKIEVDYAAKYFSPTIIVGAYTINVTEDILKGDSLWKAPIRAGITTGMAYFGAARAGVACISALGTDWLGVGCAAVFAPIGAFAGEKAGNLFGDALLGPIKAPSAATPAGVSGPRR